MKVRKRVALIGYKQNEPSFYEVNANKGLTLEWYEKNDYVVHSNVVDIEVETLSQDQIVASKLKTIDAEIAETFTRIESLRAQKQELLALSFNNDEEV